MLIIYHVVFLHTDQLKEKEISIESFFLETEENGDKYILGQPSKNKIKDKFLNLSSSENPFVLIYASCWTKNSPVNTVFRELGLYSVLAMKKDKGEISSGEFHHLTADQSDFLKKVVENPKKDFIIAGKFLT